MEENNAKGVSVIDVFQNAEPVGEKTYHIDNVYFDEPLALGDISLIQLGRVFCKRGYLVPDHLQLGWYELTVVTEGEGEICSNGIAERASEGDVFVSLPGDLHRIYADSKGGMKYDYLAFTTSSEELNLGLEELCAALSHSGRRIIRERRICDLLSELIGEWRNEGAYGKRIKRGIIEQIVIYLIRAATERERARKHDSAERLCSRVMSYIDTRLFEMSQASEVADALNYDYSYLSALFRRTTGQRLGDYYSAARFRAARLLVRERRMKIGEIAELLGYSSIYVFSRAYKRRFGVEPSRDRLGAEEN